MAGYLIENGFKTCVINDGFNAIETIKTISPDLIVLDINLPNKSGFDICKEARQFYINPILMVTAKDEVLDEVLGLELGADDYINKPVTPRVLLARIHAQLRRQMAQTANANHLKFDDLSIDRDEHSVVFAGECISLSTSEFELLWVLASHAGQEILRQDLVKKIRGFDYDGFDRSIDVRVSRIRKKLQDLENPPKKIKTIWGKGYLFVSNAWKA
ncbi:MAG: winged helix-turn-helix domain-containing protein [Gammaproteobacteria bacterium]|nr:winged helix-turn-helix domain-containing protein [Gammaproteobacteria bacterium]